MNCGPLCSKALDTYGVERSNLTVRQYSQRLGRKVNAFSKNRLSASDQEWA
jgi:IS1 family transposase